MLYVLRAPKFPVIMDMGDRLIAAKSKAQLERLIEAASLRERDKMPIIDRTAEAFALYPDKMVIAPQIAVQRWTKARIIDLYNERRPAQAPELHKRSLGSRTLEQVVSDTVALLSESR